jgi:hypothetical protein
VQRTAEHICGAFTASLQTFDAFPLDQRLQLAYEDLLGDPVPRLIACAQLLGVPVDEQAARQAAEKHAFQKYDQTGPLQFRRRGQAGVWRTSGNFTPEVLAVAQDVLGPLRSRLGYPPATGP